jgi:hypothetical protein
VVDYNRTADESNYKSRAQTYPGHNDRVKAHVDAGLDGAVGLDAHAARHADSIGFFAADARDRDANAAAHEHVGERHGLDLFTAVRLRREQVECSVGVKAEMRWISETVLRTIGMRAVGGSWTVALLIVRERILADEEEERTARRRSRRERSMRGLWICPFGFFS